MDARPVSNTRGDGHGPVMIADTNTRTDSTVALSPHTSATPTRTRLRGFDLIAWRDALVAFVLSRVLLVLVGLLTVFYLLPLLKSNLTHYSLAANTRLPHALWLMWRRFDSGFYVDIARHGYWSAATLRHISNWVFYPLYPLLIRPIGLLLGGRDTGFNVAGLVVSNGATIAAFVLLYKVADMEFGRAAAVRALVLLALFPTSFYLSAISPFSLFLALSLGSLYAARRGHWTVAALCGGLAALTRAQGLLLLAPLLWEYWQVVSDRYAPRQATGDRRQAADQGRGATNWVERAKDWVSSRLRGPTLAARDIHNAPAVLSFALVPLGALVFMVYAWAKTGDFLASSHNEIHWGRHFEPPWTLLWHSLTHLSLPNALDWNFWLLNNAAAVLFLLATVWAFRALPIIYALYSLVMVLSPLASASMQSLSRYYVVVFPALMLLALWSNREGRPGRMYLLVGLFSALQAVFMVFFVLALPAIA